MWLGFVASAVTLGLLVVALAWDSIPWPHSAPPSEPILVYCAAGMRAPMEEIAREYEQTYGVPVRLQYDGSQTLLASLEVTKRGDLYLPADESYLQIAREKDLLEEAIPLAQMRPVLAVRQGNPRALHSLDDVMREGVKLAQANPDAAAVGKMTRAALKKQDKWDQFTKRIVVFKPTVNDVANDVLLGTVDAGIVWDATVKQYPGLEAVELTELKGAVARVTVGLLKSSARPAAAMRFARYVAARDRGFPRFEKQGFAPVHDGETVVKGDPWEEEPELRLFAGAMLRPAIEETITRFENREGVKVTRIYNGCGILVAQMQAGKAAPDAYFSCDQSFMNQVHDLFLDSVPISTNQLVILVPRGNPRHIHSLNDLAKPGLKIGVGHEKQCALGVITQKTLKQNGTLDPVMKNVKVQTPTGDMLVNQLRTKSLDAVIAYVSNATEAADELDAIPVDVPCAVAVQPFAVSKDSPHRQLAQRLLNAIRSAESRERFESYGFHWYNATR
jgi:molybdenum ABC transporter molybdate-binding protein